MSDSGFVYIWYNNLDNQKYYVGSHRGNPNDGYIASGKYIKRAMLKYGIENFTRYILYTGIHYLEKETEIINKLDACADSNSYNLIHIPKTGEMGIASRAKISESNRTRIITDQHRLNGSLGQKRYNENRTAEQKQAAVERAKHASSFQKPKSSELRQRMSEERKGIVFSDEWKNNLKAAAQLRAKVKVVCEHCNKETTPNNLQKYHNENCLANPNFDPNKPSARNKVSISNSKPRRKSTCVHCLNEFGSNNMWRHLLVCKLNKPAEVTEVNNIDTANPEGTEQ